MLKCFIDHLRKFKESGYIVKSEITGKPFYGEIVVIFTEGRIDRTNHCEIGDITKIKECIKL